MRMLECDRSGNGARVGDGPTSAPHRIVATACRATPPIRIPLESLDPLVPGASPDKPTVEAQGPAGTIGNTAWDGRSAIIHTVFVAIRLSVAIPSASPVLKFRSKWG